MIHTYFCCVGIPKLQVLKSLKPKFKNHNSSTQKLSRLNLHPIYLTNHSQNANIMINPIEKNEVHKCPIQKQLIVSKHQEISNSKKYQKIKMRRKISEPEP
ncbi:hypothetical protein HYC85_012099 [Camellia sinensis]|uniref:Uncharacterized protein n=1 Tax=Camellia sinensis TaxID=4442 RepID=A0A7J7HE79_CAMSI|nr:hypothetical protein HYC85_012099 [Camellia sinensis]